MKNFGRPFSLPILRTYWLRFEILFGRVRVDLRQLVHPPIFNPVDLRAGSARGSPTKGVAQLPGC